MEELKRKTDVLLRSVLLSVGRTGLALRLLDREYKSFTYSSLPYKEMGFSSLEKYIKSIPEVASLSRDVDGEYVVHGVASEADKHVAKLIAKQRKPKRKAKAKARRPVHASMHKPGVGRSAALHRAPMRKSPQAVPFRGGVAPFRGGVTPSRGGAAPRFVPPRMMKRGASQGSSQSITRAMVEQEIAQKVQQQAKIMAAPASLNSSRTVPVVSPPVFMTKLPQHPAGNKINGMASTNRQVTVVSHQEKPPHKKSWKKKAKSPVDDSLSLEEHVNSISKSCYYHIRRIAKIQKYLSEDSTAALVHAFITCRLDNGNTLLYGLPNYLIQRLQTV
ncbi:tudor domain-containing protein 7-like [Stylophora pistillata]|uniref:tudor domain-containing protein 7-like n=1 Tax=Stylophora pistillata TaxID=50429 RepID=UPI000C042CE1|nr:tudor domain-containing protein 7-like [Stylophora pistillata]